LIDARNSFDEPAPGKDVAASEKTDMIDW
jgi:hypothetical protein